MMIRRIIGILVFSVALIIALPAYAQACSAQDVEAWRTQANNDFDLGNYEEAAAGYSCMIEVSDEQDSFAYEWRGISKQLMGDLDGAFADVNQSIELDSSRGGAYYSRGNMYLDLDDYESAIDDFTTALEKGYNRAYVYNNRGYAYHNIGNVQNAKIDYQNATWNDSEYGLAYSNLGEIYFIEGDLEKAQENYQLGMDYAEDKYRAYPRQNRGEIAYMDQDYPAAIDDYTTAIEFNPDEPNIYLSRAEAYRAIQSPNAYADYLRYIQLIQTEIVDLGQTVLNEPLDMVEGRVYRQTFDFTQSGGLFEITARSVEDSQVDTLILILGPSGSPVIGDDDSGTDEDAAIRYRIPEEGVYTILITHANEGDTGEIILSRDVIPNQLAMGVRAEVFAQDNDGAGELNLREYPSLGFDVLEALPSGARVTVVNGPFKDDDFVWWQVEADSGQVGWVVEHVGGLQTLFPAIEVGGTVDVNVDELNLRPEPSASSDRIRVMLGSETLTVIDGPVDADGFRWWQLRTAGNDEGWAVERVNDKRTLVAVVES